MRLKYQIFHLGWILFLFHAAAGWEPLSAQSPTGEELQEITCDQDSPEHWILHYTPKKITSSTFPRGSVCLAIPPDSTPSIQLTRLSARVMENDRFIESFVGDGTACRQLGLRESQIYSEKKFKYRGVVIQLLTLQPMPVLPANESTAIGRRLEIESLDLEFRIDIPSATAPQAAPRDFGRANVLRLVVLNEKSIPPLLAAYAPSPPDTSSTGDIEFEPATQAFVESNGPVVKMRVTHTGMQRVTGRDLRAQGIDLSRIQPNNVQGWIGNQKTPVHVHAANPSAFTEEDSILFWVTEPLSQTEPWRTCWLSFHTGLVDGLQNTPSAAAIRPLDATSVWVEENVRERNFFITFREDPGVSRAGWYWRSSGDSDFNAIGLPCPGVVENSSVLIDVNIYPNGRIGTERKARLSVEEDVFSATTAISAVKSATLSMACPARLVDGTRLWCRAGFAGERDMQTENFYIESARVRYQRRPDTRWGPFSFQLINEASAVASATPYRLAVNKTPGQPLELWSRTVEGHFRRHLPLEGIDPARAEFILPPATGAVYFLSELSQAQTPFMDSEKPSNLFRNQEPCDYIILTHRDFLGMDLDRLAEHRRSEGLRVRIVDVQDVYDEFNGGEASPESIQTFLHVAASQWPEGGPEYVLLVGDANWDTFDWSKYGVPNRMPTFLDKSDARNNFCSDDQLVQFSYEKEAPQYIIGRFSPQSITDLRNIVDKTIESDLQPRWGPWRARVLFAADQEPNYDEFRPVCERLVKNYLQSPFQGEVFDFGRFPFQNHNAVISKSPALKYRTSPEATTKLVETINRGAALIQYLGHGGPPVWSKAQLMLGLDREDSDLRRIRNKGMYPFVTSLSCLCGSFQQSQQTYDVCLAEEWQRQKDGGSIAMLAPSGGGSTTQHEGYSAYLMENLLHRKAQRIGDAVTAAKISFLTRNGAYFTSEQIFFGDPAVHFPRPAETLILRAAQDPQPPAGSGALVLRIQATAPKAMNGSILVEITEPNRDGAVEFGPFEMRDGQAEFSVTIPKWPPADPPRILVYAWDENQKVDAAAVLDLRPEVALEALPEVAVVEAATAQAAATALMVKLNNPSDLLLDPGRLDIEWEDGRKESLPCVLKPHEELEIRVPVLPATAPLRLSWARLRFSVPPYISEKDGKDVRVFFPLGVTPSPAPDYLLALGDIRIGTQVKPEAIARHPMTVDVACWRVRDATGKPFDVVLRYAQSGGEIGRASVDPQKQLSYSKPISWQVEKSETQMLLLEGPINQASGESMGSLASAPFPVRVRNGYDLTLMNPTLRSSPAPYGEPFLVEVTVVNSGDSEALNVKLEAYNNKTVSSDAKIEVWPDQEGVSIPRLGPGESERIRLRCHSYKPIDSGFIQITALSGATELSDSRPENNSVQVSIRETGDPDLYVHDLNLEELPSWSQPGDRYRASVKVTNLGSGPAGRSRLRFETRGKDWCEPCLIPSIAAGETVTIKTELPVKQGSHFLKITADPWNSLRETDENNNETGVRVETHVVIGAEAAGWTAKEGGWSFSLEPERNWDLYNRLRCLPGAGGMIRYVPEQTRRWVGTWKNLLSNPEDACSDRGLSFTLKKAYVDDYEVFAPYSANVPPVRFSLPAEEGPSRIEISMVRAQIYYGKPSGAFQYRFGFLDPYKKIMLVSLLPRMDSVRLEVTEVMENHLHFEIDDYMPDWYLRLHGTPLLCPAGGRLTSPVLDFSTSKPRTLGALVNTPFPRKSLARLEYRSFDDLEDLRKAPWLQQASPNEIVKGRYFQWRVVFDGEIPWYAMLKEIQLVDTNGNI